MAGGSEVGVAVYKKRRSVVIKPVRRNGLFTFIMSMAPGAVTREGTEKRLQGHVCRLNPSPAESVSPDPTSFHSIVTDPLFQRLPLRSN